MALVNDYLYCFEGEWGAEGSCRLRIYGRGESPPVVIVTELFSSEDTSITSMIEFLAAEVLTRFLSRRVGQAEPFVFVRHWPVGPNHDADYALVTFDSYQPAPAAAVPGRRFPYGRGRVRLGIPEWHDLTRGEVEALIGEPLRERS